MEELFKEIFETLDTHDKVIEFCSIMTELLVAKGYKQGVIIFNDECYSLNFPQNIKDLTGIRKTMKNMIK